MFSFSSYQETFKQKLRCFQMDESNDKNQFNYGGKVLLPTSSLSEIMASSLGESSLMMFLLENKATQRKLCVGVLEFTADEGTIVIPSWMYEQLGVARHSNVVDISQADPQLGNYAKFQPMSFDFLDIDNPKVILEKALRNYTCINTNDCIQISYCNKVYKLRVKQTKPGESICVINCNLMVEFEPAPGYEEYQEKLNMNRCIINIKNKIDKYVEEKNASQFQPFKGSSSRLDGKRKKKSNSSSQMSTSNTQPDELITLEGSREDEGYPDYDWKLGKLIFDKYFHKRMQQEHDAKKKDEEDDKAKPLFPGRGNRMP